jgi:hypothetical protein
VVLRVSLALLLSCLLLEGWLLLGALLLLLCAGSVS